jgi:hypothetical protein
VLTLRGSAPYAQATYPGADTPAELDASGLTICLTDLAVRTHTQGQVAYAPPKSNSRWAIDVEAVHPGGQSYHLGRIITNAPDVGAGLEESRVVAEAWAPGAVRWVVGVKHYSGDRVNAFARLDLMASPCCGVPGLHPIIGMAELSGELFYSVGSTIAGGATVNYDITQPGERLFATGAWQTGTGAGITLYRPIAVGLGNYWLPPDGSAVTRPEGHLAAPCRVSFNFTANVGGGAWFVETRR